ncbi:hypothetical protein DBQ65_16770, partial [Lactobacillus sp. DS3_6]
HRQISRIYGTGNILGNIWSKATAQMLLYQWLKPMELETPHLHLSLSLAFIGVQNAGVAAFYVWQIVTDYH